MRFDRVAVLDWSAAKGRRRGKDSIWIAVASEGTVSTENISTRLKAEERLTDLISDSLAAHQRLLLGVDFAFGYPSGFAHHLTGQPDPLVLWRWLSERITETPTKESNFRKIAAEMNAAFGGNGPFWGNGEKVATPGLPRLKPPLPEGLSAYRETEAGASAGRSSPKSVWQLAGAGSVGAQSLTGIPVLSRLREAFEGKVAVWPFEKADTQIVFAEVYPSMLAHEVKAEGGIPDEAQVRLLARALQFADLGPLIEAGNVHREEGWILGSGHAHILREGLKASFIASTP